MLRAVMTHFPLSARRASLFALPWFAALLCALVPSSPLASAGAVLLVLGWSYALLRPGARELYAPRGGAALAGMAALWLLMALSLLWSDVPFLSLYALGFFAVLPLTAGSVWLRPRPEIVWAMAAMAAVLIGLLALFALVQFFIYPDLVEGRARWPMRNPNALAALFNIALFPALGVFFAGPGRGRLAAGLYAALLFAGILATASRGAGLAMLAALPLFIWAAGWRHLASQKAKAAGLLALLAAIGIAMSFTERTVTAPGQDMSALSSRIGETAASGAALGERLAIWQGALEMIGENPWLGRGAGTFSQAFPGYQDPGMPAQVFAAHNDPLQFWAELGLAGPLLFYAIALALIWRMAAFGRQTDPAVPGRRALAAGLFAGMAAIALHTHVSFLLYNQSVLMLFGLLYAAWHVVTLEAARPRLLFHGLPPNWSGRRAGALLALPYVLGGLLLAAPFAATHFENRGEAAMIEAELDEAMTELRIANALSFGLSYREELSYARMALAVLQTGAGLPAENKAALVNSAADSLERATALNPYLAPAFYHKAELARIAPDGTLPANWPAPRAALETALALDPFRTQVRLALFREDMMAGRQDRAAETLADGLKWTYADPGTLAYYDLAGAFLAAAGDEAAAQTARARAAQLRDLLYYREKTESEHPGKIESLLLH